MKVKMRDRLVCIDSIILPHANAWPSISFVDGSRSSLEQIDYCVRLGLVKV
jgi:hypothetical protein